MGINKKIGILGGGQLGKMLIMGGANLHLDFRVLDPSPSASAAFYCKNFIVGNFHDYNTVLEFGQNCDLITIEIENVNEDALMELEKMGKEVYPRPTTIRTVKSKNLQKTFFSENSIPTLPYKLFANKSVLESWNNLFPYVIKCAVGGYDGRGVWVIRDSKDLEELPDFEGVMEYYMEAPKEVAMLCARNVKGEIQFYDPVEMVFNDETHMLSHMTAPASISKPIHNQMIDSAVKILNGLDHVGIMAIEYFLDEKDGISFVNEIAPRPHNSGHHTIEGTQSSQYDQHLRAILGLPFGASSCQSFCGMINILGEKGHSGPAHYEGLEQLLSEEGVFVHLYGKADTRPSRKMGHITVLGSSREIMEKRMGRVQGKLKVISK